jgi:hypothetical protein
MLVDADDDADDDADVDDEGVAELLHAPTTSTAAPSSATKRVAVPKIASSTGSRRANRTGLARRG